MTKSLFRLTLTVVCVVFSEAAGDIVRQAPAGGQVSLPEKGVVFDRRIELHEAQGVVEHWTGKERLARRSSLEARIRCRLVDISPRKLVLRGQVLEGRFRFRVRGFLELEEVYGLFFDSLRFEIVIEPRKTRLEVDRKSWASVRRRFDAEQKSRSLPAGVAREVRTGLLRQLERAHVVAFWPLLRGSDSREAVRSSLELPLWRKGARDSGEIRLKPLPELARFFSETRGQEIPLRRTHHARSGDREAAVGFGMLAWKVGADGLPAASRLEAHGDYDDPDELAELVDRPVAYRQFHAIDIWLGPAESTMPELSTLTGLPPFLPVPDLVSLLETKRDREVFGDVIDRAIQGEPQLLDALDEYSGIEREAKLPARVRAAIHFALAEQVAITAFGGAVNDVEQAVGALLRESRDLPIVVLLLRAIAHPFAKLSVGDRERYCRTVLSRAAPDIAAWGSRTLASLGAGSSEVRGFASILLERFSEEHRRGANASAPLLRALRFDLARLVGTRALSLPAEDLRKTIANLEIVPRSRGLTWAGKIVDPRLPTFFEEAMSGPTVLLLDNSIEITRTARSRPSSTIPVRPARLLWAHPEIVRALQNIGAAQEFALIRFHSRAWKLSDGVRRANADAMRQAVLFLGTFEEVAFKDRHLVRRARYDVGFRAAFEDPRMETLCLLTDGDRGDDWRLEAELLVANYLRGVRIVTYGYGLSSLEQSKSLRFLERIAYLHHGWCRFVP